MRRWFPSGVSPAIDLAARPDDETQEPSQPVQIGRKTRPRYGRMDAWRNGVLMPRFSNPPGFPRQTAMAAETPRCSRTHAGLVVYTTLTRT